MLGNTEELHFDCRHLLITTLSLFISNHLLDPWNPLIQTV